MNVLDFARLGCQKVMSLMAGVDLPNWNEDEVPSEIIDGVAKVTNIIGIAAVVLMVISASIAVLLLIIAGIRYKMAKNPDEASLSLGTIKRIIIGLIIVFASSVVIGIFVKVLPSLL